MTNEKKTRVTVPPPPPAQNVAGAWNKDICSGLHRSTGAEGTMRPSRALHLDHPSVRPFVRPSSIQQPGTNVTLGRIIHLLAYFTSWLAHRASSVLERPDTMRPDYLGTSGIQEKGKKNEKKWNTAQNRITNYQYSPRRCSGNSNGSGGRSSRSSAAHEFSLTGRRRQRGLPSGPAPEASVSMSPCARFAGAGFPSSFGVFRGYYSTHPFFSDKSGVAVIGTTTSIRLTLPSPACS